MRVGITFDLREDYATQGYDEEQVVEFDEAETILALESTLRALGHTTDRIGSAQALAGRLVYGERWDMVFNIAEGMHGFGRQALAPALLDSYRIPYTFSDPLTLAVTLHKGAAKRMVRDAGISTADFEVVEELADIASVALPFPLFIKPVAEGTSKGISAASLVLDLAHLRAGCEYLLARHRQPVLVETYLPGREFTVGILGTGDAARVLGVMEIQPRTGPEPGIYTFANKKHFDERVSVRLVPDDEASETGRLALAAWKCLGGRDAGRIDLRCDSDGKPRFLEANPLAGLHPRDSDLPLIGRLAGMDYHTLIEEIMASAASRLANFS